MTQKSLETNHRILFFILLYLLQYNYNFFKHTSSFLNVVGNRRSLRERDSYVYGYDMA